MDYANPPPNGDLNGLSSTVDEVLMSPKNKKKSGIKKLLAKCTPKVGRRKLDKGSNFGSASVDLDFASKSSTLRSLTNGDSAIVLTAEEVEQQMVEETKLDQEVASNNSNRDEANDEGKKEVKQKNEEDGEGGNVMERKNEGTGIDEDEEEDEPKKDDTEGDKETSEQKAERLAPMISTLETRLSTLELKLKQLEDTEDRRRKSMSLFSEIPSDAIAYSGPCNLGGVIGNGLTCHNLSASDPNLTEGESNNDNNNSSSSSWMANNRHLVETALLPATVGAVVGGGVATVAALLRGK